MPYEHGQSSSWLHPAAQKPARECPADKNYQPSNQSITPATVLISLSARGACDIKVGFYISLVFMASPL
jgi:hypothetical protein